MMQRFMGGYVQATHVYTTPFHTRHLSILRFWYPPGVGAVPELQVLMDDHPLQTTVSPISLLLRWLTASYGSLLLPCNLRVCTAHYQPRKNLKSSKLEVWFLFNVFCCCFGKSKNYKVKIKLRTKVLLNQNLT